MRIAVIIGVVVVLLAVGLAAYVRLAPSDPARWHKMPDDVADRDFSSGAMRVIKAGEGDLARLHGIIAGSPRTTVPSGAPLCCMASMSALRAVSTESGIGPGAPLNGEWREAAEAGLQVGLPSRAPRLACSGGTDGTDWPPLRGTL